MSGVKQDITLRFADKDDAELIANWLANDEVRRYLSSSLRGRTVPSQLIEVTLKRRDQAWNIVLVNGRASGLLVLDDYDAADGVANLWFCLGDLSMRGLHIMPEAIVLLASSPPLAVKVLTAWVGSNNMASLRCLKRADFRLVGRIKNAFRVNGVHDRVIFEKQIG